MGAGRGKNRRARAHTAQAWTKGTLLDKLGPDDAHIIGALDELVSGQGRPMITASMISMRMPSSNRMEVEEIVRRLRALEERGIVKQVMLPEEYDEPLWQIWLSEPQLAQAHDFGLGTGAGTVIASQHQNGGGWVAASAKVDESVYVGPGAEVYEDAILIENTIVGGISRVAGRARMLGQAILEGDSKIDGEAVVSDSVRVSGTALVTDEARVGGAATVCEKAAVRGKAVVESWAKIEGTAAVAGEARVAGNATVAGDARVDGKTTLEDSAVVAGSAVVTDYATVAGDAIIRGRARVCGHARVDKGVLEDDDVFGEDVNPEAGLFSEELKGLEPLSF